MCNVCTHLFSSAEHVFDQHVKTEVIFTTLANPIVNSVMEGFNGKCVPCKPHFHLLHPFPYYSEQEAKYQLHFAYNHSTIRCSLSLRVNNGTLLACAC